MGRQFAQLQIPLYCLLTDLFSIHFVPGKSCFPLQILHTNFGRIWDNTELPSEVLGWSSANSRLGVLDTLHQSCPRPLDTGDWLPHLHLLDYV